MKGKILFTGLSLPALQEGVDWTHLPLIKIIPTNTTEPDVQKALQDATKFTHWVFTSKSAVHLWMKAMDGTNTQAKPSIAVGKATARELLSYGIDTPHVAINETAEGLAELISELDFKASPYFLWPRSALARPYLMDFFNQKGWLYQSPVIYRTDFNPPSAPIFFDDFDGVYFSSPSTVAAFMHFFGRPKAHLCLYTQGPITKTALNFEIAKFSALRETEEINHKEI